MKSKFKEVIVGSKESYTNYSNLIPKNKHDLWAVDRLKEAKKEDVEPIIEQLFEWVEDINWPVASHLSKALTKFDDLIIPFVVDLLRKPDGLREHSVYYYMMPLLSNEQLVLLKDELLRIANEPSEFEIEEGYNKIATKYIQRIP